MQDTTRARKAAAFFRCTLNTLPPPTHPPTAHPAPPTSRSSLLSLAVAAGAVLWSGQTAARLFVRRSPLLDGQHALILYPCLLMYSAFALLTLY